MERTAHGCMPTLSLKDIYLFPGVRRLWSKGTLKAQVRWLAFHFLCKLLEIEFDELKDRVQPPNSLSTETKMKGIQELNPLGYVDPYKLTYIVKIKKIYA